MTWQIDHIVLYSWSGDVRRLPFARGALNIIPGLSNRGKTALIDIVDYCLGRTTFTVAEGKVRENVSWFGLSISDEEQSLFIARPNLPAGQKSGSSVFLAISAEPAVPSFDELREVTNVDGLVSVLSGLLGIEESQGSTTSLPEYQITARHAAFFLFQQQDEISNRSFLFHRQSEDHLTQVIREVLPFLLGAVTREDLALGRRLLELGRSARRLRSRIRELGQMEDEGGALARSLLVEASAAGLRVDSHEFPTGRAALVRELRQISEGMQYDNFPDLEPSSANEVRTQLLDERASLKERYQLLRAQLAAIQDVSAVRSAALDEAVEQEARLRLSTLFDESEDSGSCPVCGLAQDGVNPAVEELQRQLVDVGSQMRALSQVDRSSGLISRLREETASVRRLLVENARSLERVEREDEQLRAVVDERNVRLRISGKIALYLESAYQGEDISALRAELHGVERRIDEITAKIEDSDVATRTSSILSRLSVKIGEVVQKLNMEYAESPIRLDLAAVTVVADTLNGPVPMGRMGGGANLLACHLAAHIALHDWFTRQGCPVPGFLMLDQPSQIYYPADYKTADELVEDSEMGDRTATVGIFEALRDAVDAAEGKLQIIVTEHADINEPWFQKAIVERWRGDKGLIPRDWYE